MYARRKELPLRGEARPCSLYSARDRKENRKRFEESPSRQGEVRKGKRSVGTSGENVWLLFYERKKKKRRRSVYLPIEEKKKERGR